MKYKQFVLPALLAYVVLTIYLWPHHAALMPAVQEAALDPLVQLSHISASAPVSLITEPDNTTAAIAEAIRNATTSIDLVEYELEDPAIEQDLADAQVRGVTVRVLLDNVDTFGKHPNQDSFNFLQNNSVPVEWSPKYFSLTHQKTLVVDGTRAFVMTFNLTAQYYDSSRDFGLIDDDPSDILAIETAFNNDWSGQNIPAENANDLLWSPGSAPTLLALIGTASTSLDIYNEEMADPRITSALEAAAGRGVNVRVDMTYETTWKSALQALSAAGVHVRTYASSAPFYIHAKVIVADGKEAFVGSENFSGQSLDTNRELGLLLTRPDILTSLETTFEKDWAGSRPFTL